MKHIARNVAGRGRRWRAAAVAATLGCASVAHADSVSDYISLEGAIGGAAYQHSANGVWWQDGFEHRFDLTAPAIEGGLTGDIYQAQHWGVSWHADFAWLGTVHTQAMATPSDANYNPTTKGCNGACLPLADFLGSGHDMGFLFTLEPHLDYGGWRFGIEAGPYLHHVTWSEDVLNDQRWSSTPINLHVAYSSGWNLGYVVGASVGYKKFSLAYQYFRNQGKNSDPYPPAWTGTHMISLRYRY
jgi:hypothetical protein